MERGFRGHNNDKMTRGWSKHGSCLPTGEAEWERWRRVWRRRGDSRLKGHSVYGENERLRDIDVRREERDEERQLGMEREPLALKRERDDEAKEGQKWWEPERRGKQSQREEMEGRKEETREREAEIQWEYRLHRTEACFFDALDKKMQDRWEVHSAANVLVFIQMRESTGRERRRDREAWVIYPSVGREEYRQRERGGC